MTSENPAVDKCVLSVDGKQRTIILFRSIGTVVATLENWDNPNRSFTYRNVSAGLVPGPNAPTPDRVVGGGEGWGLRMTGPPSAKGGGDAGGRKNRGRARGPGLCFFDAPFVSPP